MRSRFNSVMQISEDAGKMPRNVVRIVVELRAVGESARTCVRGLEENRGSTWVSPVASSIYVEAVAACTNMTGLIAGRNCTGKEVIARAIHEEPSPEPKPGEGELRGNSAAS